MLFYFTESSQAQVVEGSWMTEEESARALERSRAIRRGNRGVVTKLIREAEEIISATELLDSSRRNRLHVINEQLEGKLSLLKGMDGDILECCELEAIDHELEESEAIVAKIINCRRAIELFVVSSTISGGVPPSISTTTLRDSPPPLAITPSKPRLPKLVLPRFKGDVKDWSAFWDSFKSAIHDNNDIPKVDKFNYLKSLLEGTAFKTVQGLTLTDRNYDSAIQLLKERFGNPQQIISAHMEGLLKVSICTGDHPGSLRAVYDKIMVHIRGLETLGVTSEQYGSMLIPVIMTKFPSDIRLRIARETGREAWRITPLLTTLRQEVEAREASEGSTINVMKTPAQQSRPPSNSTASSLVANSYNVRCVYCNASHFSASCDKVVVDVKDRRDILIKKGRCFNCLKANHKTRECSSTKTCRLCHKKHHQSICNSLSPQAEPFAPSSSSTQSIVPSQDVKNSVTTTSTNNGGRTVLLQTARAIATNNDTNSTTQVRILFDSGSQRSYVTERVCAKLRLKPIHTEKLQVNTFGGEHFKTKQCKLVRFDIHKPGSSERVTLTAISYPMICSTLPSIMKVDKYVHLSSLELADCPGDTGIDAIDVLVGSDYYWNFVTGETCRGTDGPVAIRSRLGWLLSGAVDSSDGGANACTHLILTNGPNCIPEVQDPIQEVLRKFWEIESIGIVETSHNSTKNFLSHIQFQDGRYEVSLPWQEGHFELPTHYSLSLNRLQYLQHRLIKDPELLTEYNRIIQEQRQKGIIEPVEVTQPENLNSSSLNHDGNPIHYIPHHAVIRRERATTKIRIVYDGSARLGNSELSINECLQTGPNLVPNLFDVLVQFRSHRIAVIADIEKAFLMIGIIPADRDVLRFLWFKDPTKLNSTVLHFRFTRVVFGLRPSPAILRAVILHHLDKYVCSHPKLVEQIRTGLYVDDLVTGNDSVESAFQTYSISKQMMKEAGLNLRKWKTNSSELLSLIKEKESNQGTHSCKPNLTIVEEEQSYAQSSTTLLNPEVNELYNKLLGVMWDNQSDEFVIDLSELSDYVKDLPETKRSVLRLSARIFDPLGLVSPLVIRLKLLFRSLCTNNVNWDDSIEGEALSRWRSLINEFSCVNQIKVPRCYFRSSLNPILIELHGFSDASAQAYGAVVYLRAVYKDGSISSNIMASKTRVAPLKVQTIPRLELLAAVILVRLVDTLKGSLNSLPNLNTYYWTDSTVVLY